MFPIHVFIILQILGSLLVGDLTTSCIQAVPSVLAKIQLSPDFDTTVGEPFILGDDLLKERFETEQP